MGSPKNIYIAIVDDDESICRSLGRLLRTADLHAIAYPSAEAFLADRKRPQFDCLVMDLQLGGMSGLQLNNKILVAGCNIPVIFITAYDDPEARKEALAAGCAGFFRKNDSGVEVLNAIRRVVAAAPARSDLERPLNDKLTP